MFRVLDNGKPAKYPDHKVDPSWDTCDYLTKVEAVKYGGKWLGMLSPFLEHEGGYHQREPMEEELGIFDSPYDYSGHGDIIQIVEVADEEKSRD